MEPVSPVEREGLEFGARKLPTSNYLRMPPVKGSTSGKGSIPQSLESVVSCLVNDAQSAPENYSCSDLHQLSKNSTRQAPNTVKYRDSRWKN